jgi:hypothetical protein
LPKRRYIATQLGINKSRASDNCRALLGIFPGLTHNKSELSVGGVSREHFTNVNSACSYDTNDNSGIPREVDA